ncbi:MAG: condensation domain-containing protein, partial [Candidatus Vecturithrix sp.]|nr:condensation domain-containing protein [Candidatus Vecturithrix sp.]
MKSIPEFLSYLRSLDIHLWVEEERLRYNAPKGVLTQELREQLRARKTEILAFLRQANVSAHASVQPIEPIPHDQPLPLSFNQQRLWFLNQLEGPNPIYNVPMAWRIIGSLHISTLERCITEIVRRHEALRTTFADSNGTPIQKIASPWDVRLSVVDLSHLSEDEVEDETRKLAFKDIETSFDLTQGPLFRGTVFRLKSNVHVLMIVVHHIIFDVWSIGVFIKELSALYRSFSANQPSPLSDLPIQYADFAHWQNTWLSGKILEQQLTYWKEKLAGPLPILELPTDSPRPPMYHFHGAVHTFMLPDTIVTAVRTMSQKEGATLFMVLLTVFKILLYRYTGQVDIIVGSPIANRTRPEVTSLIGFFVNTLVLRTDLSGNPNFLELLSRVKQTATAAYAHQDTPFQHIVESLHIERNLSHPPIFQTSFILQNSQQANLDISGLTITQFKGDRNTAGVAFDLNLTIEETESGLMGIMEYNQNLFDDSTIARMAGHFQNLLRSVVSNPHNHITELPLLDESEYQQILVEWNETQAEYPADACIHQLIEKQTEKTPHAIAVIFEAQQLTYQELNDRA